MAQDGPGAGSLRIEITDAGIRSVACRRLSHGPGAGSLRIEIGMAGFVASRAAGLATAQGPDHSG